MVAFCMGVMGELYIEKTTIQLAHCSRIGELDFNAECRNRFSKGSSRRVDAQQHDPFALGLGGSAGLLSASRDHRRLA
jgi:hypothetical protein